MRGMICLFWMGLGSWAFGQPLAPVKTALPDDLPPLTLPPPPTLFPNGVPVSKPLQPSMLLTNPELVQVPEPARETIREVVEPIGRLPRTWYSGEYLLWWTKSERVPVLVTSAASGNPSLDNPLTRVVLGGNTPDPIRSSGARFTYGWSLGKEKRAGIEIGYQFLGTSQTLQSIQGGGRTDESILGRPLINAPTGREDAVLISHARMLGTFDAITSLRVQGWEVTGLMNLFHNETFRFTALAGYRYFMVNEGFRADQYSYYYGAQPTGSNTTAAAVPYRVSSSDQLDAHNRFHGAQLGLRSEFEKWGFFASLDAKVSLGETTEVLKNSGQTVAVADVPNAPNVSYFPGGVFGQPSNSGRFQRSEFGVLPEANFKMGYQFNSNSRFYVGYQFLYLNRVVRATDQIDRTVDLMQSSSSDPFALRLPAIRPAVPFNQSDFWTQGLTFGLEWRY